MNKNVILTLLFICFAITSFAAKIKGCFITNSGDTIHVVFRIPVGLFARTPNYEKLQWKITWFDSLNQAQTLRPGEVREYCFEYKSTPVRMVSMTNSLQASPSGFRHDQDIFLRLIIDGKLRLFKFYDYSGYVENNPESPDPILKETPGSIEIFLLQKSGGKVFQPGKNDFGESLRDYLSECPMVVESINSSTCRGDDLYKLVEMFNEVCSK